MKLPEMHMPDYRNDPGKLTASAVTVRRIVDAGDVDVLCSTRPAQSPSAIARPRRSSLVKTLAQS